MPDVPLLQGFQTVETIAVLETQVDDMTAQAIAYTMEQLLEMALLMFIPKRSA